MRIGVVTPWQIDDPLAWSGVVSPMVRELATRAQLIPLVTASVPNSLVDRGLARTLDRRFGRSYLVGHALATSLKRGRSLARRLQPSQVDIILGIAASQDIAFLRTSAPVVQVADATYRAIKDFYPLYTRLNPLSAAQADVQARRSAQKTSHFLAATQWAREALVADGVSTARIAVARFGPAITPKGSEGRRPQGGPLRLLMVASDWTRKGGPDVIAMWRLLQERGAVCTLTIVGDAPISPLPGLSTLPRTSHEGMRALYASHDVLIELSASSAAGVTLTDAAGFGLPVVAARTGGVASIVHDRVTGFLVEPGRPHEAAARVMDLMAPEVLRAMSDAAQERARTVLNWSTWGDIAMSVLGAALRSHQMKSPAQ